jgi:hypothetical protein
METQIDRQNTLILLVRRTARALSILSIGLVLLFIVGEKFNPTQIKPTEWLGLLFFPFGISVGMILAWWKEGLGGCITVGSLLMFYVTHLATSGKLPQGWAWLIFASPGFLFLLYWLWTRKAKKIPV